MGAGIEDSRDRTPADAAGSGRGCGSDPGVCSGKDAPLPGRVTATGEAGSVECGALVRIDLVLEQGAIGEARHRVYGCPATIACAGELASRVKGMTVLEAAAISEREIAEAAAVSPEQRTSAELALEALHGALGRAADAGADLRPPGSGAGEEGVLVGMSGGVDSAVAAMVLRRQGLRVVGLTLTLWSDPGSRDERSCCSPEAVCRARRTAHSLGIPHLTVDASEAFRREVVDYFVEEYGRGRTPNPCTKCNARLRFGLMLELAKRLGLSRIATGHYARLGGTPPGLMRGVDRSKDQSYVLAEVSPETLRRVVFPLGEMTKTEVKTLASEAGLEARGAPESQEICFVADDDHKRFLRERLGERPGPIVDIEGRQIGNHSGIYNFTVGQRKGLGIASSAPLYVIAVEAERAVVIAGALDECQVGEIVVEGLVYHRPGLAGSGSVQVRSCGPAIPAHFPQQGEITLAAAPVEPVSILLEEPATGVAPGQTAVVYDGEAVVLAGTIRSTGRWFDGHRAPELRASKGPMV